MAKRKRDEESDSRTHTVSAGRVSPGAFVAASAIHPPEGPTPQFIAVAPTAVTLTPGSSQQLTASIRDQFNAVMSGQPLVWSSSNESVATVDSNGLVTAVGEGACEIRATSGSTVSIPHRMFVNGSYALALTSGDGQSGVVGTATASPLVVRATLGGVGVAGLMVNWSTGSDGNLPSSSVTDANGFASATFIRGPTAGTSSVVATLANNGAVVAFTVTGTHDVTAKLIAVSSRVQSTEAGQDVPEPPSVQALDQYDNPVSGETIAWAVAAGGGSLDDTGGTTTGSDGIATVTSWTTGATEGLNTVTATVGALVVTFDADGVSSAVPATISIQSGGSQTNVVAGQNTAAYTFRVKDASLAGVLGVTVDFTVEAGGGSLSVPSALTDANGDVTVTLTTGTAVALNTIRAAVSPTIFTTESTTTVAGPATKLVIAVQPAVNGTSGSPLPGQPVVDITDANGNRKLSGTGSADTITASILAGDGSISAGGVVVASAGRASFSTLTIFDPTGGNNQVVFTSALGYTQAVSSGTNMAPPTPTKLGFVQQPTSVLVGNVIAPPITVEVQGSNNQRIDGAANQVSIARTDGGALNGTLNQNAVDGTATFAGLSLPSVFTGTLTASSIGLASAVSSAFSATSPPSGDFPSLSLYPGMAQIMRFNCTHTRAEIGDFPTDPLSGDVGYFAAGSGSNTNFGHLLRDFGITDNTAPFGPDKVMRTRFPNGLVGGQGPITFQHWNLRTTQAANTVFSELYLCRYMKLVGNGTLFQNHPVMTKWGFVGAGDGAQTGNQNFPGLNGSGSYGSTGFSLQFRQQGNAAGQSNRFYNVPNNFQWDLHDWVIIEEYYKLNTLGSVTAMPINMYQNGPNAYLGDGIYEIRLTNLTKGIGPTLVMRYTDMCFIRTPYTTKFYNAYWNPTFGGGAPNKTQDDDVYHALFAAYAIP